MSKVRFKVGVSFRFLLNLPHIDCHDSDIIGRGVCSFNRDLCSTHAVCIVQVF